MAQQTITFPDKVTGNQLLATEVTEIKDVVNANATDTQSQLDGKEPSLTVASQAEMEAGTEAGLRSMSPLRVAQAIQASATQIRLNTLEARIGLNTLRDTIAEGWTIYGFIDGFADEYEDESGISTKTLIYDAFLDLYKNYSASGVGDIAGSRTMSAIGGATYITPTGVGADTDPYGGTVEVMSFDGSGDAWQFPDEAQFAFTGDFSIALWAKASATPVNEVLISQSGSGGNRAWELRINATSQAEFSVTNVTTGWDLVLNGGTAVNADEWHYYFVKRSGSTVSLYLDGSLVNSGTLAGSVADIAVPVSIGMEGQGGGQPFAGVIDEVRIWVGSAESETVPLSKPATTTETVYVTVDSGATDGAITSVVRDTGTAPTHVRAIIINEQIDAVTPNTDNTFEVTLDGVNWATLSMVDEETYDATSKFLVSPETDVSGTTTGTNFQYRFTTANVKSQNIKGVYIQWR